MAGGIRAGMGPTGVPMSCHQSRRESWGCSARSQTLLRRALPIPAASARWRISARSWPAHQAPTIASSSARRDTVLVASEPVVGDEVRALQEVACQPAPLPITGRAQDDGLPVGGVVRAVRSDHGRPHPGRFWLLAAVDDLVQLGAHHLADHVEQMTRAPRSARWRVHNGALIACSMDNTVMPSSGALTWPPAQPGTPRRGAVRSARVRARTSQPTRTGHRVCDRFL